MTATMPRETRTVNGAKGASGKAGGNGGDDEAGAAGKGKGKKLSPKMLIIAIVAVLGLGYGGYTMFLAPPPKPAPPAGGDIVALDPTTLNLADGHYLKIGLGIQLLKGGKATSPTFQVSQAQELTINEFSDRTVSSLSTNAARVKLQKDLLAKIKKAYPDEVYALFVTQFVTQ